MIITHKNRLKGKRAVRQLRRYGWACNQVWNYLVQIQRKVQRNFREGLPARWPSQYELQKLTAAVSKDLGLHAQTIQEICAQFVKSRDQHRKCPRFRHASGAKRSLGWVPFREKSRQITSSAVTYLGNTYRFFGAKRRPLPETAKCGCFVEDARGRWWVCFQVEVDALPQAPDRAVGIDLGLKDLATLSNEMKIEAPRYFRQYEEKLALAQRAGNKERARALNEKIANCRRDHAHKWTAWAAGSFRDIFVGDLSSSRLAKTKMAKSVYDAGWGMSKQFLRYKASRHGGSCEDVSEKFTTQTCSSCGGLPPERPRGIAGLGMRQWMCSLCGAIHDRDVNAAKNHLIVGLSARLKTSPVDRKIDRQPPVEESRVAHGR